MPALNLIRLPLPFDQLTNRTLDVHGWVMVLNITPNMEVMPANERNVCPHLPSPHFFRLLIFYQSVNLILIFLKPIPSARLSTLNLGDRIWICCHSFNQNQYGVLFGVTTIIFGLPNVSPMFLRARALSALSSRCEFIISITMECEEGILYFNVDGPNL
ncbi:hypothetical protein PGTUg99_021319 [Puccinia graminis f. sp. tritici]|uniref:Uncharacterized protein n=1 Tax=Puccinia graminis f. sp. tritici TaxID=56615 RepID=A0A5B0NZF6_PUCGR|nr:hypothetical protein PGTUg99_021319 [Puccinia graminis f. sp. tritici]